MFTISCASACVRVGILLATVAIVTCDYDGNQAANFADRSLDTNVLCNGGRCTETGNGISGAMWFGPRLGRKRRSDEKIEPIDQDISDLADVINSGPWTWIAYSGGGDKRHATQFTPRLGRELSDAILQKYMAYDFDKNQLSRYLGGQEDLSPRHQSPPPPLPQFAPRLGRHLTFNPSPRLGRHLRFVRKA